eukprot:TRINITY_DN3098_c0_g3_i6.p1 TRINITY_DN3098_c0_g3~~TRINITY_DN3098_c0_g3_i6.p1  ORF type:complete len:170 (+),score=49.62 TRINITY_DN3098_c0_g3_i6:819-1328(+)
MSTLEDVFRKFCSFGAKGAPPLMDNAKFAKFARETKILGKGLTSTDVDLIWTRVAKKERKINFATFQEALDALAQKKGISVIDLENKILAAGGPSSSGTKAVNSGITAKLTDSSQYTGSHQHRFDKDGKGRGLDGRDSVATGTGTSTQQIGGGGSGYVSGYSNQGTYGK